MLNLPTSFKRDLLGQETSLVPLVIVGDNYISTNSITYDNQFYRPILLNIPSIRESIDIQKRSYKVSSLTLNISNIPYKHFRFSDTLSGSVINQEVNIYWISPASKTLDDPDTGALHIFKGQVKEYDYDQDTVKISVEDYSQGVLYKDLPLESISTDSTQMDKYKGVVKPMCFGRVDRCPIVIDTIDGVKTGIIDYKEIMGFGDTETNEGFGVHGSISNVFIGKNDTILPVPETIEEQMEYYKEEDIGLVNVDDALGLQQWSFNGQNISFKNTVIQNAGFIQAIVISKPDSVVFKKQLNDYSGSGFNEDSDAQYIDVNLNDELTNMDATILVDNDYIETIQPSYTSFLNDAEPSDGEIFISKQTLIIGTKDNIDAHERKNMAVAINKIILPSPSQAVLPHGNDYPPEYTYGEGDEIPLHTATGQLYFNWVGVDAAIENENLFPSDGDTGETYSSLIAFGVNSPGSSDQYSGYDEDAPLHFTVSKMDSDDTNQEDIYIAFEDKRSEMRIHFVHFIRANDSPPAYDTTNIVQLKLAEIDYKSAVDIKDAFTNNFYVNVKGRPYEHPTQILTNIIQELKPDVSITTSYITDPYWGQDESNSKWKYAFSQNETINAKELVEGISSASPYLCHFDSMGNFKYDVLHKLGGGTIDETNPSNPTWVRPDIVSNYSENHKIKEADVIDFSFSRTEISQCYQRIELSYNFNYERQEFDSKRILDMDYFACYDWQGGTGNEYGNYNYAYYGLIDGNGENIKQVLKIDDIRSKVIRDDATAERFCCWLMSWYGQQHLLMTVKLGLKYLNLEIGDLVEFDKIIGGEIYPYSINYTEGQTNIWDQHYQSIYPIFQVVSTTKNLKWIEIEVIQLHQLWDSTAAEVSPEGDILSLNPGSTPGCTEVLFGCTEQTSCNFDPSATTNDGSCVDPYLMFMDSDSDGMGEIENGHVWVCNDDTEGLLLPEGYLLRSQADYQGYVEECCDDCVPDLSLGNIDPNTGLDCEQQCNGEAVLDECGLCGGDCASFITGPEFGGVLLWACGNDIPENFGLWCNCEEGVGPSIPWDTECGECGGLGPDEFGCCSGNIDNPNHQVADCHGNCYDYYGDQYPNPVIPPNDYDDCGVCLPPEGAEGHDPNLWGQSCEFHFLILPQAGEFVPSNIYLEYPIDVSPALTNISLVPPMGQDTSETINVNGPGEPECFISNRYATDPTLKIICEVSGNYFNYNSEVWPDWMNGTLVNVRVIVKRYLIIYNDADQVTYNGPCEDIFNGIVPIEVNDLINHSETISIYEANFDLFDQVGEDPYQITESDNFNLQCDFWWHIESVTLPDGYEEQFPDPEDHWDSSNITWYPSQSQQQHNQLILNHAAVQEDLHCPGLLGDVNNDTGVNPLDVIIMMNYYTNNIPCDLPDSSPWDQGGWYDPNNYICCCRCSILTEPSDQLDFTDLQALISLI